MQCLRLAFVRPLTLSNTAQNVIAKALNATLEVVAGSASHAAQRGFVRGRQMSSNTVGIEAALELFFCDTTSDPGAVLQDVQAAFPSLHRGWHPWVMRRKGGGAELSRAAFATDEGSSVELFLHGRHAGVHLGIAGGINQECLALGSLWAIGYDPVIRHIAFGE